MCWRLAAASAPRYTRRPCTDSASSPLVNVTVAFELHTLTFSARSTETLPGVCVPKKGGCVCVCVCAAGCVCDCVCAIDCVCACICVVFVPMAKSVCRQLAMEVPVCACAALLIFFAMSVSRLSTSFMSVRRCRRPVSAHTSWSPFSVPEVCFKCCSMVCNISRSCWSLFAGCCACACVCAECVCADCVCVACVC
jgi:hypothetical protein